MQASDIDAMHAVESSHWWFWGKRQLMRRLFADRLRRGGLRILDIGCGAGANALELSAWGDVTAADRSVDALAWVRSRGVLRAVAADGKTGDGCGVLLKKPEAFLRAVGGGFGEMTTPTFGIQKSFLLSINHIQISK